MKKVRSFFAALLLRSFDLADELERRLPGCRAGALTGSLLLLLLLAYDLCSAVGPWPAYQWTLIDAVSGTALVVTIWTLGYMTRRVK